VTLSAHLSLSHTHTHSLSLSHPTDTAVALGVHLYPTATTARYTNTLPAGVSLRSRRTLCLTEGGAGVTRGLALRPLRGGGGRGIDEDEGGDVTLGAADGAMTLDAGSEVEGLEQVNHVVWLRGFRVVGVSWGSRFRLSERLEQEDHLVCFRGFRVLGLRWFGWVQGVGFLGRVRGWSK